MPDEDLLLFSERDLLREVQRLRDAIRAHRDSSGHDLCWYHPELWNLLPEKTEVSIRVPPRCEFLQRCAEYRDSLEDPLAAVPYPEAIGRQAQLDKRIANLTEVCHHLGMPRDPIQLLISLIAEDEMTVAEELFETHDPWDYDDWEW